MSRSAFMMGLEFHMLDARPECAPDQKDWSGGHVVFKTKVKLRSAAPSSWIVDDQYGAKQFDKEAWARAASHEILRDLQEDGGDLLKRLLLQLYDQAQAHCDEHHADIRERFKKP